MSRKKKQPDAALEAAQNAQQASLEIQRELWNSQFKNAAPYFDPATGEYFDQATGGPVNALGRNAAPVFYDLATMEPIKPKEPEHGSTSSTDVTKDRPVVPVEINAETLYGIKPDCCDLPRLLKAILDELISHRGPIC